MGTSALYVNLNTLGQASKALDMCGGEIVDMMKKMLRMALPGRRKRERSEKRFMDVVPAHDPGLDK